MTVHVLAHTLLSFRQDMFSELINFDIDLLMTLTCYM